VIVFNENQAIFFFFIGSEMQRTRVKIPPSFPRSLSPPHSAANEDEEERRKKTKEQGQL
jgi:hypothetical protein